MSYYIREIERYKQYNIVDDEERIISKHKTRISAVNSRFNRMVKDRLKKYNKKVVLIEPNKE